MFHCFRFITSDCREQGCKLSIRRSVAVSKACCGCIWTAAWWRPFDALRKQARFNRLSHTVPSQSPPSAEHVWSRTYTYQQVQPSKG